MQQGFNDFVGATGSYLNIFLIKPFNWRNISRQKMSTPIFDLVANIVTLRFFFNFKFKFYFYPPNKDICYYYKINLCIRKPYAGFIRFFLNNLQYTYSIFNLKLIYAYLYFMFFVHVNFCQILLSNVVLDIQIII